jgi:hypothetical protein
MTAATPPRLRTAVHGIYYLTAVLFFLYLVNYYLSGEGGPTVLAVTLVPVCFILFVLDALRSDDFYRGLGWLPNHLIGTVYIGLAIAAGVYLRIEFFDIQTVRMGFWYTTDLVMGLIMALLIMEYARKRYFVLFVLNILLILYAVYGWVIPGMFGHPGLSWTRIVSAMSVETTTGVYSRLPQLALTLIGSFILVLSVLRAFGCVDSILLGAGKIAQRSPYALPQAAVIGSFGVATVSGSGAANAATTGSATIPAMIGAGMPRTSAAAVETAASLGGQLMPPIMGISAFLMADFLGQSYFEVVARGYAPALIYFVSVVLAVYLLSIHYRTDKPVDLPGGKFDWTDGVNLAVFAGVVTALIGLMGFRNTPPMIAALNVFLVAAPLVFAFYMYRLWTANGQAGGARDCNSPGPPRRYLRVDDGRPDALARDPLHHDRRIRHHRHTDQARRRAGGGGEYQSDSNGAGRLRVRRLARHRIAACADLYSDSTGDRATHDQIWRRSLGRAFLRLLPRRLGRAHAAHVRGSRSHRQDRRRFFPAHPDARDPAMRVAFHADGRSLRAARTGLAAGHGTTRRHRPDPDGDDRRHIQHSGAFQRQVAGGFCPAHPSCGHFADRAAASERVGCRSRRHSGLCLRRLLVPASPQLAASQ